ncbi:MAG: helix-turn-helix domain-containing protein [Cyclobacteriaceae bacterium]
MGKNLLEVHATESLRAFIDCFWIQKIEADKSEVSPVMRCLPSGMVDLIIHIKGGRAHGIPDCGTPYKFPDSYFTGVQTRPILWNVTGSTEIMGVRFTPEGIMHLFKSPVASFTNKAVDIQEVFTKNSEIISQVKSEECFYRRISIIESFVQLQLKKYQDAPNHIARSLSAIRKSDYSFSNESIRNNLYLSERQTQRLFKHHLGVNPKTYHRVVRFREAVKRIEGNQKINWTGLAYSLGYSDQAHFIRDFKQFSGITPTLF